MQDKCGKFPPPVEHQSEPTTHRGRWIFAICTMQVLPVQGRLISWMGRLPDVLVENENNCNEWIMGLDWIWREQLGVICVFSSFPYLCNRRVQLNWINDIDQQTLMWTSHSLCDWRCWALDTRVSSVLGAFLLVKFIVQSHWETTYWPGRSVHWSYV